LRHRAGADPGRGRGGRARRAAAAPPAPSPAGAGLTAGEIMQRRGFLLLLSATVILVAAAIFALVSGDRTASRAPPGQRALPGINRAWLARGSLDVSGDTVEWLDRRILDLPVSRIASVTLVGEDGVALMLSRATANDKFAVAGAPADAKFKDAAVLSGPGSVLAALDLADVKPSADQPLPAAGISNAAFMTFDGLTIDIRLFARDFADWVTISATGKESV